MLDAFLKQQNDVYFRPLLIVVNFYTNLFAMSLVSLAGDLNILVRPYDGNGDAMFVSFPPATWKRYLLCGKMQVGTVGKSSIHILGIAKSYSDIW